MKYLEALAKKGLTKETVSKSIQKRIEEVEAFIERAQNLEGEALETVKRNIEIADEATELQILKFDPVRHLEKIKSIEAVNALKKARIEGTAPPKIKKEKKPIDNNNNDVLDDNNDILDNNVLDDDDTLDGNGEAARVEAQARADAEAQAAYEAEQAAAYKAYEAEQAQAAQAAQAAEAQALAEAEAEAYQEEEEFEVVAEVKPKKKNLGMVLMGVGFLVLTVGAVNFFRKK